MFQNTLAKQEQWAPGAWSLAAGFHALVILAIVAGSFLVLRPIRDPELPDITVFWIEPPPPPLESAPVVATPPRGGGHESEPLIEPPPPVEPLPVPEPRVLSEPEITPSSLESPAEPPGAEGSAIGTPGVPGGTGDGSGTGAGRGYGPGDGSGSRDGTGGPWPVGGEVTPPRLVVKVTPEYPDVARRIRLEGRVSLQVVVGPDGSVETVEVVAATNPLFTGPAVEAVKRWRYTPATWRGRAVRVFYSVEVTFVLR